jgi:hypothetical protein
MLTGLLLGVVIGLVIGPILRSWLTWQEYRHAEREARLAEDLLRRLEESTPLSDGELPNAS